MTDPAIVDQIIALIKRAAEPEIAAAMELAAGEYARGRADERRATLLALGIKEEMVTPRLQVTPSKAAPQQRKRVAPERSIADRKRAPKGMVHSLVMKALTKMGGLTPQEILDHAETDLERMVKPASVRSELRVGFEHGLYHESRGQWFLTKEREESAGTKSRQGMETLFAPDRQEGGD